MRHPRPRAHRLDLQLGRPRELRTPRPGGVTVSSSAVHTDSHGSASPTRARVSSVISALPGASWRHAAGQASGATTVAVAARDVPASGAPRVTIAAGLGRPVVPRDPQPGHHPACRVADDVHRRRPCRQRRVDRGVEHRDLRGQVTGAVTDEGQDRRRAARGLDPRRRAAATRRGSRRSRGRAAPGRAGPARAARPGRRPGRRSAAAARPTTPPPTSSTATSAATSSRRRGLTAALPPGSVPRVGTFDSRESARSRQPNRGHPRPHGADYALPNVPTRAGKRADSRRRTCRLAHQAGRERGCRRGGRARRASASRRPRAVRTARPAVSAAGSSRPSAAARDAAARPASSSSPAATPTPGAAAASPAPSPARRRSAPRARPPATSPGRAGPRSGPGA